MVVPHPCSALTPNYLVLEPVMRCFVPGAGVTKINKAESLPEELAERQQAVCYDLVCALTQEVMGAS